MKISSRYSLPILICLIPFLVGCQTRPKFPVTSYQPIEPREVEKPGARGELFHNVFGGMDFWGETIVRLFEQDGKVAVCALYKLLSPRDISKNVSKGLREYPRSNIYPKLTITAAKDKSKTFNVMAKFINVHYIRLNPDDEQVDAITASARNKNRVPGNCVLTAQLWDPAFKDFKPHLADNVVFRYP